METPNFTKNHLSEKNSDFENNDIDQNSIENLRVKKRLNKTETNI